MLLPAIVLGTGLCGGADAADALGDARLARRRLRADGAREGPARVAASSAVHALRNSLITVDDGDRPPARRAHLRRGHHRADLRHRRLRPADGRRRQPARLRADPGRRARRGASATSRQPARRPRLLAAQPAHPGRGGAAHELRRARRRVPTSLAARAPAPPAAQAASCAGRSRSPASSSRSRSSLVALFAPLVAPYGPTRPTSTRSSRSRPREHLLGTDELGRDIFSRDHLGRPRVDRRRASSRRCSRCVIAVPIGLVAGYYRGWIDPVDLARHRRAARVPVPDPRRRARGDPRAVAAERDDRARDRRRARADPRHARRDARAARGGLRPRRGRERRGRRRRSSSGTSSRT